MISPNSTRRARVALVLVRDAVALIVTGQAVALAAYVHRPFVCVLVCALYDTSRQTADAIVCAAPTNTFTFALMISFGIFQMCVDCAMELRVSTKSYPVLIGSLRR